jgi:hypothetical protein
MVIIAVIIMLVFSVVWIRSSVVSLEYQLSSLEIKKKELMRDAKMLGAQRTGLLTLNRFERVASSEGGLMFPDRMKVVYVKNQRERGALTASFVPNEAGRRIIRE